ncbi:hypothetical protein JTB14_031266 [Gonioctena quinquepunctata]|nr:hypothetical protein JTB14_031266 [Gonioctena quinquepunctata]
MDTTQKSARERTKKCEGEDKAEACRNCGGESHKAKDSKEEPYCLTCKTKCHRNVQCSGPLYKGPYSAGLGRRRRPSVK